MLSPRAHAWLLGALALLALTTTAAADLAPPDGYHSVRHVNVVRGLGKFPEHAFFLHPTHMGGGHQQVDSGKPFSFYKMASPRLYAVPRAELVDGKLSEEWFEEPGRTVSGDSFRIRVMVPDSDPTTDRETLYEVVGIDGTRLEMKLVHDRRSGAFSPPLGSSLLPLLVGAALLAIGVAWVVRRSGPAPAPEPESEASPA